MEILNIGLLIFVAVFVPIIIIEVFEHIKRNLK